MRTIRSSLPKPRPQSTRWRSADAVMQMDLSDQPFVVFRNASHGEINVVYRREDGNIGWIDPATPVRSGSEAATQKKSSRSHRETAAHSKAKKARGRR